MSWRFRKSFSPIPGVRLTLSPSGISTSVGVGPARYTVGPSGARLTARIPGTGISFQHGLQPGNPGPSDVSPPIPSAYLPQPLERGSATLVAGRQLQEIKSAGSGALTTSGLAAFKHALLTAQQQHDAIEIELQAARHREGVDGAKYGAWASGWLLRRVFKKHFASLELASTEATELRRELEQQLALSRLQTEIEMPDGIAKAFYRLCDEFSAMASSHKIWDDIAARRTDRVAERTIADRAIDRKEVKFKAGRCRLIETTMTVPHFQNANGGDLFLYPGFVVYFASGSNFALLDYAEVELKTSIVRFHEEEAIPSDAEVIGHTWAKANKDGSPDRRFANNYQIPIVRYAILSFTSTTGLNEEYLVSNVARAEAFATSWDDLRSAVSAGK